MNHSAKITSKGQITLPADVRKELGLGTGDRVDFIQNASGNYELRARKGKLADLFGVIKLKEPVTGVQIDDWVKEARGSMGEMRDDWD